MRETQTTVTWATKAAKRGFTVAQNVVLFDERLPSPARLLYVQLAHYAWRDAEAFPTQEEIAANLGVGDRQLRRYAAALEERWLLDRRERGRGQSVEYVLHEPAEDYVERAPRPAREAKKPRLRVVDAGSLTDSSSDIYVRPSSDISVRAARTSASEPSLLVEAAAEEQDLRPGFDLGFVAQDAERQEEPAAAQPRAETTPIFSTGEGSEPVTDQAIRDAVAGFRDADPASHKSVIPEAHALPAAVFDSLVERAHKRRGGVGLLIKFLRIARAERAAAFSAQLAHELGQTASVYVPAPWVLESLKREDTDRYVRVMASNPAFPRDLLVEAVADAIGGDGAEADRLERLFDAVRAGDVDRETIGTPEQERERWVLAHADDPDVGHVINGWSDVDDTERDHLHDLVATHAARADDAATRSAA